MKKTLSKLAALTCLLTSGAALADVDTIKAVEEKLSKTFTNFQANYIKESPLEGLFEIHTSESIIYFSPESELMMFGRLYNKDGQDLTLLSMQEVTKKRMEEAGSSLSKLLDKALVLNKGGDISLTIFSNPECGYCQAADQWLKEVETAKNIKIEKRIIFLNTPNFSDGDSKIRHIICSNEPEKAYENIHSLPKELRTNCDAADEMIKAHDELVKFFAVGGTPTFLLENGETIAGFDRKRLSETIDTLTTKMEISENGN